MESNFKLSRKFLQKVNTKWIWEAIFLLKIEWSLHWLTCRHITLRYLNHADSITFILQKDPILIKEGRIKEKLLAKYPYMYMMWVVFGYNLKHVLFGNEASGIPCRQELEWRDSASRPTTPHIKPPALVNMLILATLSFAIWKTTARLYQWVSVCALQSFKGLRVTIWEPPMWGRRN